MIKPQISGGIIEQGKKKCIEPVEENVPGHY